MRRKNNLIPKQKKQSLNKQRRVAPRRTRTDWAPLIGVVAWLPAYFVAKILFPVQPAPPPSIVPSVLPAAVIYASVPTQEQLSDGEDIIQMEESVERDIMERQTQITEK